MKVSACTALVFAPVFALSFGCVKPGGSEHGGDASNDASATPVRTTSMEASIPLDGASALDAARAIDAASTVDIGKSHYTRLCQHCHGDKGQGYAADEAPALANEDLLAIASDDFLRDAILRGRPGTTMSAWANARGGPLSESDVTSVVAYVRTWQKRPSEAPTERKIAGDKARGAAIYTSKCIACHGPSGNGGKYGALGNAELLASASDGFLATTIERGRIGTPMVGFGDKLTPQQIDDVVTLLRSWQKPPEETPNLPPKPMGLLSIVQNPKGEQPAFDPAADFVPVDLVKKELERHATMVIIDARPPGDYARMHVAGAISVPFYQVAEYAPQIPKDRYILTYCACPHASSVKARDALRTLGYKRVAVLDEGINVWRDRGYPVRGGAKP